MSDTNLRGLLSTTSSLMMEVSIMLTLFSAVIHWGHLQFTPHATAVMVLVFSVTLWIGIELYRFRERRAALSGHILKHRWLEPVCLICMTGSVCLSLLTLL